MHSNTRHDYLGVIYKFRDGKVEVSMFDYIDKLIKEFPEDIGGRAETSAADHRFKIRDKIEAKYLPEEQAVAFHHMVAQLLFLS